MEREEVVREVAKKIWEITGKDDSRTLQNWYDAQEIVSMVENFLKPKRKSSSSRKSKKS